MADELAIDSKALIFATLADVYLSSGMIDEAISILKDGLSRNPTYTLGKIILGRAYYIKGDTKEALKILEEIYEESKESESENLYLGHCYKKLGDYEKAIRYYQLVLKINPQNSEAKQALEMLKPTAKPAPKEITLPVVTPKVVLKEEKRQEEIKIEPIAVKEEAAAEVPILPEIGLEPIPTTPFETLTEPMNRLLKIKMVKGVFILSRDGLLIQNYYQGRADIEEICALVAAICNEGDEAFKFLKEGGLEKCIIEKSDETICVISAGDSLLCIITQPEVKPGLVFVYARKVIDEIREILG